MEHVNAARKFLDDSANRYHSTIVAGWERLYHKKREHLYRELRPFHVGREALELGSADGVMTAKLCRDFERLTVVDGSATFLEQIRKKVRAKNLVLEHSLFEEFEPRRAFDTIFMTHILEHLDDPVGLLRRGREWLAPSGRILIDVPNADSIHRLIGVKMGLLATKDSLNEQDLLLGHRRVYTPSLLEAHVREAGLKKVASAGIMIKPLSNRQIESQWSDALIDAFFALGKDFPEMCSEIYLVAEAA